VEEGAEGSHRTAVVVDVVAAAVERGELELVALASFVIEPGELRVVVRCRRVYSRLDRTLVEEESYLDRRSI